MYLHDFLPHKMLLLPARSRQLYLLILRLITNCKWLQLLQKQEKYETLHHLNEFWVIWNSVFHILYTGLIEGITEYMAKCKIDAILVLCAPYKGQEMVSLPQFSIQIENQRIQRVQQICPFPEQETIPLKFPKIIHTGSLYSTQCVGARNQKEITFSSSFKTISHLDCLVQVAI